VGECRPKEVFEEILEKILEKRKGRSDWRCGLSTNPESAGRCYLSPSPPEEPPEPQDGAGLGAAGAGAAQLGAAGAGAGAGFGAAGAAGLAAAFLAGAFLALAFFAAFFGAAALDFLADFFADFLAFLADFFEDFFADFFVTAFFLLFLDFLPPFFFFALAIVILLFAAEQCQASVSSRPPLRGANRSVQSWTLQPRTFDLRPWTACRPVEKLNRVHHRN
jgi:hypothetical protein